MFIDKDIVQSVLDDIERAADAEHFRVLAYCFMPEHLHLLVQGESDTADLQRFVKGWKQITGFKYAKECGSRLWQVGFFDYVLRSRGPGGLKASGYRRREVFNRWIPEA